MIDGLRRYRAAPFLEGHFGVRRFDKELIELLKRGGTYSNEDILTHLNIDPSNANLVMLHFIKFSRVNRNYREIKGLKLWKAQVKY